MLWKLFDQRKLCVPNKILFQQLTVRCGILIWVNTRGNWWMTTLGKGFSPDRLELPETVERTVLFRKRLKGEKKKFDDTIIVRLLVFILTKYEFLRIFRANGISEIFANQNYEKFFYRFSWQNIFIFNNAITTVSFQLYIRSRRCPLM